ncbi:hypothetical protein CC1G_01734 [Coprinopsis cinerea okayama7|uniref:Uncharacterized protein n=1 Tax=Coprinopsis cinerea (strain Okayama-7 / 130 / ATCC MYA-4618 / FGSC 9003) TaxID=240176 RepID=A8N2L7_COPC7|nr:hypothetical protein CC1G_01734 [Coprinopsis cinerea okayama7\|eukprot:XP_001829054.1 hypothetical protein CC1G_01734 [Coprinopsis cinerea okayama7\
MSSPQIHQLLGASPSSAPLVNFLSELSGGSAPIPEVKAYSDAVYFNYYPLGISLLFSPNAGYKPRTGLKYEQLELSRLALDSIDVYNTAKIRDTSKPGSSRPSEIAFATYKALPLEFDLATNINDKDGNAISRPARITITEESTGKDFVGTLGEPDRKGGGAGPSSGSIGIWCEWSADGIMVEFGGDEARGPQAWERGKDAIWRVVTVFAPKRA